MAFGAEKVNESPVAGWTAWALAVADRIDPVGRLQIAEDGTSIEKPALTPEAESESQRR